MTPGGLRVVKVGGGASLDRSAIATDIAALRVGRPLPVVMVHGAGAATTEMARAFGVPVRMVTSPSGHQSRFCDRATMDLYRTAVAGENAAWVEALQRAGVNAVGLSGLDGRLLRAHHKKSVRSLEGGKVRLLHGDHTGSIERVDVALLQVLLLHDVVPVVAPLGISSEGVALNVDGDRVAGALAVALGAAELLLLSDVPGLLRDVADPSSLVAELSLEGREAAMGWALGRMKKKVMAAFEAVESGVPVAVLGDGRLPQPLAAAAAGRGTIVRSAPP